VKILVIGGTGTVGSHIVRELLARKAVVQVLTRSENKAKGLPTGAESVIDKWEQQSLQFLPAWMVFDFRLMYKLFQDKGFKATPADIDLQTNLLGHAPRSLENFATETARTRKA
jgi:UDP-glucose 4-epimerase